MLSTYGLYALLLLVGGSLSRHAARPHLRSRAWLVRAIDAALPQTQCRECGYAGCRPYAEAIVAGRADIDRCPPGGVRTSIALAGLTGQDVRSEPATDARPPAVAYIDETLCIGCTKCIEACPVDAIAGAAKLMHTVIESECTGCRLCIEPCPVDCIEMRPPASATPSVEFDSDAAASSLASMPCIRCAECSRFCPEGLLPQRLYRLAQSLEDNRLREAGLDECTLCGMCDRVCPSGLPLRSIFERASRRIAEWDTRAAHADHARRRFLARLVRRERARDDPSRVSRKKRDTGTAQPPENKRAYVAEAIRRARARRTGADRTPTTPKNDQ